MICTRKQIYYFFCFKSAICQSVHLSKYIQRKEVYLPRLYQGSLSRSVLYLWMDSLNGQEKNAAIDSTYNLAILSNLKTFEVTFDRL